MESIRLIGIFLHCNKRDRSFIVFLFLCLSNFFYSHHLSGQSILQKQFDFEVKETLVTDALLSLCEKADISISFRSNLFTENPRVSFQYQNKSLRFLLNACLKNTEVGYKWDNNRLVLFQKPPPNFTISGFVEDSLSGERLVAANVYDAVTGKGTVTNNYGFFSLSIPRGKAELHFSYLGFNSQSYHINIKKNLHYNIALKSAITLNEIVVTDAKHSLKNGLPFDEAPNFLTANQLQMPGVGGEADPLNYFKNLSGVQSDLSSLGGIHVRGGNADQNLILLDGVPVYNPSHSFGLFSIFNENIVKNARLYKGRFPAQFGGRLSSVIDIQTKEGNKNEFKFGANVSLFATNVFAEGPIVKDKTSFFASARRTHIDPVLMLFDTNDEDGFSQQNRYYFYDINFKINHRFSEKDRLFVSFYKGADDLKINSVDSIGVFVEEDFLGNTLFLSHQRNFINLNWGNTILSTRWNHLWNEKLFSNTTFTYSQFKFNFISEIYFELLDDDEEDSFEGETYSFLSNIEDIALKIDFDYFPDNKHHFKFGGGILKRVFQPNLRYQEFELDEIVFEENGFIQFGNVPMEDETLHATEFNFYIEDNIQLSDKLTAQIGLHNAIFTRTDVTWASLQPRLSFQYQLTKSKVIYAAVSKMGQFLHVLSPAGISMPFDLWVPSTKKVRPQQSWQYLIGTNWKLPLDFNWSLEAYYKKLDNLVTYGPYANTNIVTGIGNFNWEDELTFGEGWNYGIETSLKRTKGNTTGFLNYAWSKAERQFDNLSSNQKFPYRFNREHTLKLGINHAFSPQFNIFAIWSYGSGQPTTSRLIEFFGDLTNFTDLFNLDFGNSAPLLNNIRLPANHQLDINFNYNWSKKRVNHTLSLGLLNVYNHKNVLLKYQSYNFENPNEPEIKNIHSLPLFPSLRYGIKF